MFASTLSRLTSTVLAAIIVASASATVLLTSGRAEGAQQHVLSAMDRVATRAVSLTAPPSAGLDSSIVERLARIDGIAWSGAFSAAQDGRATGSQSDSRAATREVWSTDHTLLNLPSASAGSGWASPRAIAQLGLVDSYGSILLDDETQLEVRAGADLPEFLESLDPTVLVPMNSSTAAPVTLVIAIADNPGRIAAVERMILSVAAPKNPDEVKLETSAQIAEMRSAVEGRLGSYGREIVLGTFAITAVLVGTVLLVLAMMRRKDYGRRRALGATRGFILALVTAQGALAALVGALSGAGGALIALACADSPLPSWEFVLAVVLLLTFIAAIASVPPATYAANRDPAAELRVA